MEAPQWARVRGDANFGARRGAWHEVVRLTAEEAVIQVGDRSVSIPRTSVQVVPVRPQRWTVVPRPSDAINMPMSWGSKYAVCPTCAERAPLKGQPTELRCGRCGGVFPIAWDDPY
jgi:hypothetical protein